MLILVVLPVATSTTQRSLLSFSRSTLITASRLASGAKTGCWYRSLVPTTVNSFPSRSNKRQLARVRLHDLRDGFRSFFGIFRQLLSCRLKCGEQDDSENGSNTI